jgi:hypothetical protein
MYIRTFFVSIIAFSMSVQTMPFFWWLRLAQTHASTETRNGGPMQLMVMPCLVAGN